MIDWPWGTRAVLTEDGITERLPDDYPVEWWVCCRLDEPWTWKILTHQHTGTCVRCYAAIIYRKSAKSPTNPGVKKICRRCAEQLAASGDEPSTRSRR